MDPSIQRALAARLRFYRDLGLYDLYRRPVDQTIDSETRDALPVPAPILEESSIPPRKPIASPPSIAPAVTDPSAALRVIREDIGDCTRCVLHQGRNKIVFGDGSPDARLVFVGEGPGADEDAQGLPFVG